MRSSGLHFTKDLPVLALQSSSSFFRPVAQSCCCSLVITVVADLSMNWAMFNSLTLRCGLKWRWLVKHWSAVYEARRLCVQ